MFWSQRPEPPMPTHRNTLLELPFHLVDASNLVVDKGAAVYYDFVSFVGRDNVLEVAVALIIGSAFTAVSSSLVSDVLTPLLSLVPFLDRNLINKFVILSCGRYDKTGSEDAPVKLNTTQALSRGLHYMHCEYNTLEQAAADGAITLSYGRFLETSLQFLFSACSLYVLIKSIQIFWHKDIVKETQKCLYCKKLISKAALRCAFCTSWLDGREEKARGDWLRLHMHGLDGLRDDLAARARVIATNSKHRRHS